MMSLLASHLSGTNSQEQSAWVGGGATSATESIIRAGTQLGPYKISGPIRAGGMGQVFRATDTRLGRSVAIKISQEKFSDRFEREARAIASLSHPNICTLHDVGPNYLVMELIEGETLRERLKRGKLSMGQTIQYSVQIADALAAAHAKGIVHRDLKPANVMLTKSGVKVLDFGLAKSEQEPNLTAVGAVMGTPAYMAPEQFEGKGADARTDIYALGLLLTEMATGKRTLSGQADSVPLAMDRVVKRCLEKDPDERWQSARDLKWELESIAAEPAAVSARSGNPVLLAALAVVVVLLLAALAFVYFARKESGPGNSAYECSAPGEITGVVDCRFAGRARGRDGAGQRWQAADLGPAAECARSHRFSRDRRRQVLVLVPRQPLHRVFRRCQVEEDRAFGRAGADAV